MEALKIILSKVRDGEMSIEEAIILIEAIGVNKANKENKSRDLILDPQETPVTPATPTTIPWTPITTRPFIGERTTPMPGWNEVICGKSGGE